MMLDINTIDSDISKIDVTQLRRMITMENKVFEDMYRLILYDNSQPNAGNNKVVKAYIDSQVRALNHIEKLLDKHKLVLDELNKTTRVIEENNIKNIKSNEKNEQDNKDALSLFEEVEENLE